MFLYYPFLATSRQIAQCLKKVGRKLDTDVGLNWCWELFIHSPLINELCNNSSENKMVYTKLKYIGSGWALAIRASFMPALSNLSIIGRKKSIFNSPTCQNVTAVGNKRKKDFVFIPTNTIILSLFLLYNSKFLTFSNNLNNFWCKTTPLFRRAVIFFFVFFLIFLSVGFYVLCHWQ